VIYCYKNSDYGRKILDKNKKTVYNGIGLAFAREIL
jgi:hypothetical protein